MNLNLNMNLDAIPTAMNLKLHLVYFCSIKNLEEQCKDPICNPSPKWLEYKLNEPDTINL